MTSRLWTALWPVIAIGISIILGGVLILIFGNDPISTYGALIAGAFGDGYSVATTLAASLPLMLVGVGVALSFRSGLFNIGASGQYWLGAIVATWIGTNVHLPPVIHLPLAILGGMAAGFLWAAVVPGLAKAYRGAHEVITTLMMSYIAVMFGHFLLEKGPMQTAGYLPQSAIVDPSATIAILIPGTQLSWGILFAPVIASAVAFVLKRTPLGFTLRMTGHSPKAARYAGANPVANILLGLGLSGAIAGLAGAIQVLGVDHRLYDSFDTAAGYTGIVVAILGKNTPFGALLAALLFGALENGAGAMQITAGVPAHLVDVIEGLIIFFISAEGLLRYFRRRRRAESSQEATASPSGVE
jgi:simple sugar transport system permease protein